MMLKAQLFVDNLCEETQYSFLDYISNGFDLNFMVAVDFPASNGNPSLPQSLHYIDPQGRLNSYQQAILRVGEVVQFNDSDKHFPAWGFGGKLTGGSVTLHGPTLFGQVINEAANIASESLSHNRNKYFILLVITQTKDDLVRASDLPLLILIVGVGNADFKGMEKHAHWINSLALSTEYTLRTGAFDHTGKTNSSPEAMKEVLKNMIENSLLAQRLMLISNVFGGLW